jgi:hypothetical protein
MELLEKLSREGVFHRNSVGFFNDTIVFHKLDVVSGHAIFDV